MLLSKLHIYQYRNISDVTIECHPNINCIIGKNGIGKTNLLDSIYYLAFCKSNILSNDSLNILHEHDSFIIQGDFTNKDKEYAISCSYTENKEKRIICNDKKYARFSDHIGLIPLIFISPGDITLINGGGSERRKFLDSYISLYDTEYLQHLLKYNKLLAQRNSILKQSKRIDYPYLEIIDEQIVNFGIAIQEKRKAAVEELEKQTLRFYHTISSQDSLKIHYESHVTAEDYHKVLRKNFEKDCILGYSSTGIHRDDLVFSFNSGILKQCGSQGQKKSFLLAIKFAQYHILKKKKQSPPLLLLDDLFDKLDSERTQKVFEIIGGDDFGQIFITDTDKTLLHTFFEEKKYTGTFWTFENGEIREDSSY
jgi:DNA replication and repair protein RecF